MVFTIRNVSTSLCTVWCTIDPYWKKVSFHKHLSLLIRLPGMITHPGNYYKKTKSHIERLHNNRVFYTLTVFTARAAVLQRRARCKCKKELYLISYVYKAIYILTFYNIFYKDLSFLYVNSRTTHKCNGVSKIPH